MRGMSYCTTKPVAFGGCFSQLRGCYAGGLVRDKATRETRVSQSVMCCQNSELRRGLRRRHDARQGGRPVLSS